MSLTTQRIREGEAQLSSLLRRVDREVHRGGGEAMDLPHVPSDVTRAILQSLQMLWMVRGALLHQAKTRALGLFRQGMSIPRAALMAGQQLNLPPRRVGPGSPGPLHPQQVRQYHRRQEQRGRRPGQDPRMRRRQREGEAMVRPAYQDRERRIALAQAGLRRAQTQETRARSMMRTRPNQALRALNDALARQERIQRLLRHLQGTSIYR